MKSTVTLAALCALLAGAAALANAQPPAAGVVPASDPFVWLEDVHGARAMAWVAAENAKTLHVLRSDPNFNGLYADALKIAQAKDRIPSPSFIGGQIYNFWQDDDHVRGIWRRTTLGELSRPRRPQWTTVLDLDALAKAENANWVWQGADCRWPAEHRCLLVLSDGGEDATTVREFDLGTAQFVTDGFVLPRGKQRRRVGRPGHAARLARVDPGRAHDVGLSVHRQAARARPAALERRRSLSRRDDRRRLRRDADRRCTTAPAHR